MILITSSLRSFLAKNEGTLPRICASYRYKIMQIILFKLQITNLSTIVEEHREEHNQIYFLKPILIEIRIIFLELYLEAIKICSRKVSSDLYSFFGKIKTPFSFKSVKLFSCITKHCSFVF